MRTQVELDTLCSSPPGRESALEGYSWNSLYGHLQESQGFCDTKKLPWEACVPFHVSHL